MRSRPRALPLAGVEYAVRSRGLSSLKVTRVVSRVQFLPLRCAKAQPRADVVRPP